MANMRTGWMHVAGFEGSEKFSPKTLTSAVFLDETENQTIESALNVVRQTAENSLTTARSVQQSVAQYQGKLSTLESKIGNAKLRRVNTSGQEVSNGDYLQAFNPLLNTWEWVTFPNTVNVEYQTVERFADKPVFVKWIETTLPDNSAKDVLIANNVNIVRTDLHHYYYGDRLRRAIPYIGKSDAFKVYVVLWGAYVQLETLITGWNNARVAGHVYYIKL